MPSEPLIFLQQALSPAQIEALGPDNADQVTNKQREALGTEQREALEMALNGVSEINRSYSGNTHTYK